MQRGRKFLFQVNNFSGISFSSKLRFGRKDDRVVTDCKALETHERRRRGRGRRSGLPGALPRPADRVAHTAFMSGWG